MTKKKILGGFIGLAVLIAMALIPLDPAVWNPKALTGIGCLFCAIIWIAFGFMPDYVAAISMSVLFAATGSAKLGTAFAAFSGSTVWIMIGALSLGTAAGQSGFLKRCALLMMKVLPATFSGQCMAFIISGTIMSPLVPSTAAKSTIVAPMAQSTSRALGIEDHSKPAAGMFMAFYTGYILTAACYLSGSFVSYSLVGLFEKTNPMTWTNWFVWSLPFLIVMLVLMSIIILWYYKPAEKISVTKEFIQSQLDEMGAWSWQEKLTGGTLVVCLILWIFERSINIQASLVACAGAMVILTADVLNRKDFRAKVPWDSILMIGCFVSVSSVFTGLGIDKTVSALFGEQMAFMMSNPYVLVICLCAVTFVLRFIFVSLTACATLTTVMLMPFCDMYGIHPWILAFVAYIATNIWFLIYQTAPMIMSLAAIDSQLVKHSETVPGSFQYMIVCVVGLLVSVPFWKLLGLC